MMANYVCPRCTGPLTSSLGALDCPACALKYPVQDEVPYLAFYGEDWYVKLREVLLYRDFCIKVKSGGIERDRSAGHQAMGADILENLNRYFDQACARIDFTKRPKILDLGAGCGEVAQRLSELGAEVWAVDMNMYDLHHDVRWMTFGLSKDLGFFERIRGVRIENPAFQRAIADADYLPFADQSFDFIVLRAVAHHLFDLNRFMAEANRVLRPGGEILLIAEPLASVVDDPAEYSVGDLDYEEGMHETRPYFYRYRRALKAGGFSRVAVQCYYVGLGYRVARWQRRWKFNFDLNSRLAKKPVTGAGTLLLDLAAGCMNLYAQKRKHLTRKGLALKSRTLPEIPMAELLGEMHGSPSRSEKVVRDFLPKVNRHSCLNLDSPELDRMAARAVRGVETIDARTGRYLLSVSVFYLTASPGAGRRLAVHYQAAAAESLETRVRFLINGEARDCELNYVGWNVLHLALPEHVGDVVELRIEQPGLVTREQPGGGRDIGLAVSRIEVVGDDR